MLGRVAFIALILIAVLTATARSDLSFFGFAKFQAGVDAANRGDYATASKEWRPLAEQGDATAPYNLGVMYDNGLGVAQDYGEAAKWYRRTPIHP